MISIKYGCPRSKIITPLDQSTLNLLETQLSFKGDDAEWISGNSNWDGTHKKFYTKTQSFPTGMTGRVVHYLEGVGHDVEVLNAPHITAAKGKVNIELFDYQKAACISLQNNPWGILYSPPRSGKTMMASEDILYWGLSPVVVIVPSVVSNTPASEIKEKIEWCVGEPVGFVGDGLWGIAPITVVTSASAYVALVGAGVCKPVGDAVVLDDCLKPHYIQVAKLLMECKHLVYDEVHHLVSQREKKILSVMNSTVVRRGLSGTPWIEGGYGFIIEENIGPVVYHVKEELLIEKGYRVPQHVDIIRLEKKMYTGKDSWQKVYKTYIVENDERNNHIVNWSRKHNSEGRTVLILVTQKKHGSLLKEMMPEAVEVYGSSNSAERKEILDKFNRKDVQCIISTVMNEAVDIPSLDCTVLACGGKDGALGQQRQDRAATKYEGKDICYHLDFLDEARGLRGHAKKRLERYTNSKSCKVRLVNG